MRGKPITNTAAQYLSAIRVSIVVIAFAALGFVLLQSSRAATYSVPHEVEGGAMGGNANKIADILASGGNAVRFGSVAAPPSTPTGLKTHAGGDTVALRWLPSTAAAGIQKYRIYIDGVARFDKVMGFEGNFPYKYPTSFVDMDIPAGTTRSYQIQAYDNSGKTSPLSQAVTATRPATTAVAPEISVDASANPALASWLEAHVAPFIRVWYPKISATYHGNNYTPVITRFNVKIVSGTDDRRLVTGDGTTMTISIGGDDRLTNAGKQDFQTLSQIITTAAMDGYFPNSRWMEEALRFYPYTEMIEASDYSTIEQMPSYQTSMVAGARFVGWVDRTYRPGFVKELATKASISMLSTAQFREATGGKTVEQLWTEFSGRKVGPAGFIRAQNDLCLTGYMGSSANEMGIRQCIGADIQQMKLQATATNSNYELVAGPDDTCYGVSATATGENVAVQATPCSQSLSGSHWQMTANGSLVNVATKQCLATKDNGTTVNTPVVTRTCDNSSAQSWKLPDAEAAPSTPVGLRTVVGGADIVLNWDVPTDNPYFKQYDVYRNGTKIGVASPDFTMASRWFGTAFTDTTAVPGTTYNYQVRAVAFNGKTSALSQSATASRPATAAAPLQIRTDIGNRPKQLQRAIDSLFSEIVNTWQPKFQAAFVNGAYTVPTTPMNVKLQTEAEYRAVYGAATFTHLNQTDATLYINENILTQPRLLGTDMTYQTANYAIGQYSGPGAPSVTDYSTGLAWAQTGIPAYSTYWLANMIPIYGGNHISTDPTKFANYYMQPEYTHYAVHGINAAAFILDYINRNIDNTYLRRLNIANHTNSVTTGLMQFSQNRNIDEVWKQATGFNASNIGRMTNNGAPVGVCVGDGTESGMKDGFWMILQSCDYDPKLVKVSAQKAVGDEMRLLTSGKCMTSYKLTGTDNAAVSKHDCHNDAFYRSIQQWKVRADGSISVAGAPEYCLDITDVTSNSRLMLNLCNGSQRQKWTIPQ